MPVYRIDPVTGKPVRAAPSPRAPRRPPPFQPVPARAPLPQQKGGQNADAILSPRPADGENWVRMGHWAYTASGGTKRRNVRALKYEQDHRHLHVEYHGGRIYVYVGVPPDVARQVYYAPSIGKAIARLVKGHYSFTRG